MTVEVYKKYVVKFCRIVRETEKAILLETWDNRQVWLPSKCVSIDFKYTKGVAVILPEWLYIEKKLNGKEFEPYHHPKKIEPQHNQEAIDELKL